ncbi:MAG: VCBS repeat-containing protein [Deltaproteobacteria bacterium]|nr:VCBS repeat-containing protein [Deltaproteobacteria bacterium]
MEKTSFILINKTLQFTDVTEKAGVGDTGYGIGCCAGDYDNDGDVDILVANIMNRLICCGMTMVTKTTGLR